jgi:four helix bundle protein
MTHRSSSEQTTDNGNGNGNGGRVKGGDIAARLLGVAAEVIHLAVGLRAGAARRLVASQIVRSSTSAGANYEEARAAESRADFIHKIGVAAKELRETIYWLRLIERTQMSSADVGPLILEVNELVAILITSARTARSNAQRPNAD